MKNVDKLSQIAEKMRKLNSIDINDYVKPRQTGTNTEIEHREENVYYIKYIPYADIKNLDTSKDQYPFRHFNIDNGSWNKTYDEELYNKVISRLENIIDCLLNGMAKECKTLFSNAGYPTIGVCDITEKDYSKRFSEYLSKCNDILCNRYDTDITIKLAEIKLKYYRPKLYNSLFYAYCKLYDIAYQYKTMHYEREEDSTEIIKLLSEKKSVISNCVYWAEACASVSITIKNKELKEVRITGIKNGNARSVSIPEDCFVWAANNLTDYASLKGVYAINNVTLTFDSGQEFEDAKKWILDTLSLCTLDYIGNFDKSFAKSFNGLYRYIKDCDFVGKLEFPRGSIFYGVSKKILTKERYEKDKTPKEKVVELIRILFDLPASAETPMMNYIDRKI